MFDPEFAESSKQFFKAVKIREFDLLISPLIEEELQGAPREVLEFYEDIRRYGELVGVDDTDQQLSKAYLRQGILTENWETDALHVAIASAHRADLVVSWNYTHLVNYDKIRQYNAVNELLGYHRLDIRTPREVISND